jgi:hypothetical protein
MSSDSVRAAIRADWSKLSAGLRFIETINRSLPQNPPLPLPDVWGSLGFEVIDRRPLTMGENPWMLERGIVTFLIIARSGHGDGPGIAAATAVMRACDGWVDPTGNIFFSSVGAPRQAETEADGNWFLFIVAANYEAQERVQLP